MLGYTRVIYSELCRLCAAIKPVETVNIFDKRGIELQLEKKIQTVLHQKILQSDNLPKAICTKCLLSLEEYYKFHNNCTKSESLLTSYLQLAQSSSDFQRTGEFFIQNSSTITIDLIHSDTSQSKKKSREECKITVAAVPHQGDPLAHDNPDIEAGSHTQEPETIIVDFESECNTSTESKPTPPRTARRKKPTPIIKYEVIERPKPVVKSEAKPTVKSDAKAHREPVKNTRVYECAHCLKTFKRREHLYQHKKLHTGNRPYICNICGRTFVRKEHLLRHMTAHTGSKEFTCDLCGKSFSRHDNLLKHKKTHVKEAVFDCKLCGKKFRMRHYYNQHVKNVHGKTVKVHNVDENFILIDQNGMVLEVPS